MAYCSNCGVEEVADQQFCANCGTATSTSTPSAENLPYFPMDPPVVAGPAYAGYWWRVLAYIADAILLALVVNLPLRLSHTNLTLTSIVNAAAIFTYSTLLLTRMNGQTVGMMMSRIRCVDERSTGPVTLRQAIRRGGFFSALNLIGNSYHYQRYLQPTHAQSLANAHHSLIVLALLAPAIIDVLWPLWDKKNQTLHDKFAHTVVLRRAEFELSR